MSKKLFLNIPDEFWGLFKSVNMDIYIEVLLNINEEYMYNDYFLSKENCVDIINEFCNRNRYVSLREETENIDITNEPPASLILNRLLNKFKWLSKNEDYSKNTTYIVIPDYSAIFIEAFEKILKPEINSSEIYIQNIYSNIYSVVYDSIPGGEMLVTAEYNTKMLNKSLQDMLHNMNKYFSNLIQKNTYSDLLEEHLGSYVENIAGKKYHILKTNDNFYRYKNSIKQLLSEIRNNDMILKKITSTNQYTIREIIEYIDAIENGFYSIEKRINIIDEEHRKYIRTTVNRLNYLLNRDEGMKGSIINLINLIDENNVNDIVTDFSNQLYLFAISSLSKNSFYHPQKKKEIFEKTIKKVNLSENSLTVEEILKINKNNMKYSISEILNFIESNMKNEEFRTKTFFINNDKDFELLILAYNMATMVKSKIKVKATIVGDSIHNGNYIYPDIVFKKEH